MSGLDAVIYSDLKSIRTAIDQLAGQNLLTSVHSNQSIPLGTTTVTIQPAAGQKWLIDVTAWIASTSVNPSEIRIRLRDATTYYGGVGSAGQTTVASEVIGMHGRFEVTNTIYLEIVFSNTHSVAKNSGYSYYGTRLS